MNTSITNICSLAMASLLMGTMSATVMAGSQPQEACWGQATMAFAQEGMMGEHASGFDTPRLGLRNLARDLAGAGLLMDDSMHSLGAFVAAEYDMSIDACAQIH